MATVPTPARRLIDAELVRAEFRYSDPENIEGLDRSVPDADAHPVIIGFYDERPPGGRKANPDHPLIWCCHCGKRTHWEGRVVRDDHGKIHIIGARVCGREHYGDRFGAAERIFKAERERRRALRRWQNVLGYLTDLKRDVDELLAWPGLTALELKREEIRRASPSGYQKLLRYCSTGAELVVHREERDHDAEAVRDRRYAQALAAYRMLPAEQRRALRDAGEDPQVDTAPIYRRTSENLGYVLGGDFLRADCDARARAIELGQTIDAMTAIAASGTDTVETGRLSELLRKLSDGSDELRSTLHRIAFTDLFFSDENLPKLERWSAQEARFGYTENEGRLVVRDSSNGRTVVEPIGDVTPPRCPAIDGMRFLDEQFEAPGLAA